MNLNRFPRLNAFGRPTPLEELTNLRRTIGCRPRVFVKRDDLTAIGMGGNKNRKLDFVMADALAQGADVIITTGAPQSNHARQTLANARRLGMECHLVLTGEDSPVRQGNLLLDTIMGATLHFVGDEGDADARADQRAAELAAELARQGRRPYVVPLGASIPLGSLGYIESVMEVAEQSKTLGVTIGHGFLATGSGGTQAGAEVGAREAYPAMRIHGVAVSRDSLPQREKVAELVNQTYEFLGIPKSVRPDDLIVHDEYYQPGYGIPNEVDLRAIELLARTEGLLIDPVYTGKAFAGMLDLLRKGQLDDAEAVLFFHTGGSPAVFAMPESFQSHGGGGY